MRYIKDILVEKAILHVVDVNADEAILTTKNLDINEDVEEFVRKHVVKSLNDEETFTARFLSADVTVAKLVQSVIDDTENFIQSSQDLTKRMFDLIKKTEIPSGDMLFVQYISDDQRCFGIMKLDYQMSYMHDITFNEEELHIGLISQEVGLPSVGQRLKKCVFFTKAPESELEMIVVDKKQKLEESNENYFVEKYLEAVVISDDTDKTRRFRATIEKWSKKNLTDDITAATDVRETINDMLLENKSVDINQVVNNVLESRPNERESLAEAIHDAGYRDGSSFEVDRQWVDKKMKSKHIKTDTGITIRGEFELFRDNHKFVVKNNGDGTVDYIIKNVRNVVER